MGICPGNMTVGDDLPIIRSVFQEQEVDLFDRTIGS